MAKFPNILEREYSVCHTFGACVHSFRLKNNETADCMAKIICECV